MSSLESSLRSMLRWRGDLVLAANTWSATLPSIRRGTSTCPRSPRSQQVATPQQRVRVEVHHAERLVEGPRPLVARDSGRPSGSGRADARSAPRAGARRRGAVTAAVRPTAVVTTAALSARDAIAPPASGHAPAGRRDADHVPGTRCRTSRAPSRTTRSSRRTWPRRPGPPRPVRASGSMRASPSIVTYASPWSSVSRLNETRGFASMLPFRARPLVREDLDLAIRPLEPDDELCGCPSGLTVVSQPVRSCSSRSRIRAPAGVVGRVPS